MPRCVPLRFRILGSGSSGNAALLLTDDTKILVDAGFSVRRLEAMLADSGESLANINAIFLTHEHGDHSAALKGLAKHPHIQVFANDPTRRSLQRSLKHQITWQIFETGTTFNFRDLEIRSFAVPHDAQEPVGFHISHGHGDLFSPRQSLAWVTDLGHVPAHIREHIRDADILVIEANYCLDLIDSDSKRPWSVKQRIKGRHGHLSNTAAHDLIAEIASPRWQHIYLAHLSRDCNSLDAVQAAFAPSIEALNCQISIVSPGGDTPFIKLS